jgi:hypothetical protein
MRKCVRNVICESAPMRRMVRIFVVLYIFSSCPDLHAWPEVIRGSVRLEGHGLSEVLVSDGFRVVSSDANGDYRIDLPPDAPPPKDVFIVRPAGTRCVGRFWKVIPKDAEGAMGADFDLVPDERSGQDDFSFLVISDLHLRWGPLPSLGRVRPAPAFVACLGDLVNNEPNGMGDPRPLVSYGNVISQHLWMPVFTAFGNHDWSKAPEGSEDQSLVYRLNIAPRRYAFECGTRLFVVYDTETPRVDGAAADKAQREWVEAVVARSRSTGPIIVLQHIPPADEQVAWLAQLGRPVQAIFSGHHHSNHLKRPHGILEVNTPPFQMGGIDFSPAGFRVVTIEGDRMQMAFHPINLQKHLRVVAPAGAVKVQDGSVDTVVTAVDAYVPVTGVRAGLEGGGPPVELQREGRWTWRGAVAVPEGVETGSVHVSVADRENETWPSRAGAFQVAPAPAGIATATPWPQFRRDSKGHSSTPDLVRPPL